MPPACHTKNWCGLAWSAWIPLAGSTAEYARHLATTPGFYRVRATELEALAYIGQTGRNLRERTRALARHAHRSSDDPPWNDPHTGAPGLWAWRVEDGLTYEVSVAPAELSVARRQCMEDLLLFRHRLEMGESTLCNHGTFHAKWTRPSNRKAGMAMRRLSEADANPAAGASLSPVTPSGQPADPDWLGLPWVEAGRLDGGLVDVPLRPGVYRLVDGCSVVYVGESIMLRDRLRAHAAWRSAMTLRASYVPMWPVLPHHLKERETDLIGAFYEQVGEPPVLQYRGRRT